MQERLQKVIAQSGVCSRRKAEELILAGKVKVNGKTVSILGTKVYPSDRIVVDGQVLAKEEKVYYVLNKPKGCVTTAKDDKDRKTVMDYVPSGARLFPVGRLDYDTSGVLIMTNDGSFANKMTHPRYHLPKTYEINLQGILSEEDVKKLRRGFTFKDEKFAPAKVYIKNTDYARDRMLLDLTIYEGHNHQVKNMMAALGHQVRRLHRSRFGFVTVDDLRPGECRRLKPFDVRKLIAMSEEKKLVKQVFYAKPLNVGDVVELDEKTAHHLFDVTRTTPKETIRVVDGFQQLFYGHVQTKPWIEIVEKLDDSSQSKLDITLCVALIKADKWEWMLQKATELGVSRIVPFTCKNTMIQIEPKKASRKLERWQTICQGACQQSNRTDLVQIEPICTVQQLDRYKSQLNICAWEKEAIEDHICCTLNQIDQSVTFVIGPEGGITKDEAMALEEKGFVLCSLGQNILRAETAACYVCSTAQYAYSTNLSKKRVGQESESKEIQ